MIGALGGRLQSFRPVAVLSTELAVLLGLLVLLIAASLYVATRRDEDRSESGDGAETKTASNVREPEQVDGTSDSAQNRQRELLDELRRLDRKWSKDVDKRLLFSVGEYHPDDYEAAFGSLEAAIERAGLSPPEPEETPDTDNQEQTTEDEAYRKALLDELRQLDEEWSRDIDKRLLFSVGEYHPDEYEKTFGSLDRAISEAGVRDEPEQKGGLSGQTTDDEGTEIEQADFGETETGHGMGQRSHTAPYSREDVLGAIRALSAELGRPPTSTEMQQQGSMSMSPVYQHFDTWGDARAAATGSGGKSEEDSSGVSDEWRDTETASGVEDSAGSGESEEIDATSGEDILDSITDEFDM